MPKITFEVASDEAAEMRMLQWRKDVCNAKRNRQSLPAVRAEALWKRTVRRCVLKAISGGHSRVVISELPNADVTEALARIGEQLFCTPQRPLANNTVTFLLDRVMEEIETPEAPNIDSILASMDDEEAQGIREEVDPENVFPKELLFYSTYTAADWWLWIDNIRRKAIKIDFPGAHIDSMKKKTAMGVCILLAAKEITFGSFLKMLLAQKVVTYHAISEEMRPCSKGTHAWPTHSLRKLFEKPDWDEALRLETLGFEIQ